MMILLKSTLRSMVPALFVRGGLATPGLDAPALSPSTSTRLVALDINLGEATRSSRSVSDAPRPPCGPAFGITASHRSVKRRPLAVLRATYLRPPPTSFPPSSCAFRPAAKWVRPLARASAV